MSRWHSNVQWHHVAFKCPVASRGIQMSSGARWQQVSTGVARLHLVAVRSHFGLRLDGRNNPARASNRPGRRITKSLKIWLFSKIILPYACGYFALMYAFGYFALRIGYFPLRFWLFALSLGMCKLCDRCVSLYTFTLTFTHPFTKYIRSKMA